MDCTAVLLNWRRPQNLKPIVRLLKTCKFIKQIIVWDNSLGYPDPQPAAAKRKSQAFRWLHNHECNVYTYGRFWAASRAAYDAIYVQDDDYAVNNIAELYNRFVATEARRITANLPDMPGSHHWTAERHKTPWIQLGFGAFFHKEWLDVFDWWRDVYGEDELFYRKADRIFTMLAGIRQQRIHGPPRHEPVLADLTRLAQPDGSDCDRDEHSLWKQPDHYQLTMETRDRCSKLVQPGEIDGGLSN